MNSYKIYLTKSAEAARLISDGLKGETPWSKDGGEIISIGVGGVENHIGESKIPLMYHNKGYFYAKIEYRNGPDESCPEYSLVIC